jgi:hypothetical protein
MRLLGASVLAVLGVTGCGDGSPPVSSALFGGDGGIASHASLVAPRVDVHEVVTLERTCPERAPLACAGGCARRQGCCITGARPTGVCLAPSDCPWRCALDCEELGRRYGAHVVEQCEALCLFVALDHCGV